MTEPRHRRLAPVACVTVWDVPDGVHLSVEEWVPKLGEWVTGLALCGQSAEQGALPPDSVITCRDCKDYRAPYERALHGRPVAEQEHLAEARAAVARVRALHHPYRSMYDTDGQSCAHCNQLTGYAVPYPCDTIKALGEE